MNQAENPLSTEPEKPRRFQFGLGTLLLLPVVGAVLSAAHIGFGVIGVVLSLLGFVFLMSFHPVFRRSHDLWLVRVFCNVGAVVLVLLSLLFSHSERTGPQRRSCRNTLKAIAFALHCYHTDFGCYPPAYVADETGKPMHSWRVLLLPYLDKGDLYNHYNFSEPWNGPNNSQLQKHLVEFYICPDEWEQGKAPMANYLAVIGNGTLWPGSRSISKHDIGGNGSEKVMIVEVADSGIEWLEPKDLDIAEMSLEINDWSRPAIRSQHPGGAYVALGDGTTRFLERRNQGDLKKLLRIDNGRVTKP
jgi:hypothetical protein